MQCCDFALTKKRVQSKLPPGLWICFGNCVPLVKVLGNHEKPDANFKSSANLASREASHA